MIQDGKLRGFAMSQAIPVRTNYTAGEVRRFAQRAKEAAQARRLLAIAAVLVGDSREEAATIGGMDRQTLRDWVIRFNEQGPDGLINIPSPGVPPKLNSRHKAFLARIVDEGPIPAIHGVVRWRACDLIMRLYEEVGLSGSDDTVYRALKNLGFSHVSARPKAYKQNAEAMHVVKKTSPSVWRRASRHSPPAQRERSGSKTRCGWGKRTSSPIAGPGRVHALVPPAIKGPNRPTCSVRSAPNAEPAPPSCCRPATPKLCSFTSMRSQPKSLRALTLFSSSIKPAGMASRPSRFQATSRSCSCRHAHPNSTAKKISGNSCGRTRCRTEFSNPSTTSSITAATPGTRSSISRGKSCPSRAAIGQPQVIQSEDWYKSRSSCFMD